MNIQDKFDQYFENKLSEREKLKFENDLHEQDDLKELYKAYSQINHILKSELSSPILSGNDPLLEELTTSQRLEIENDVFMFGNSESNDKEGPPFPENEKMSFQMNPDMDPITGKTSGKEAKFIEILKNPSQESTSRNTRSIRLYFWIAAAAVISFLAGKPIIEYFYNSQKKLTAQELYMEFYNPKADNELKSLNFDDYRLKTTEFDLNRSNLNSPDNSSNHLKVQEDDYELSLLFLGLISMERNDFQQAFNCFSKIRSSEKSGKIHSATYYLALTYLNEGRQKEAGILFEELINTKNPYRKTARKILRSLKQE